MSSTTRKPAVAGAFYPADEDALRNQLDTLIVDDDEQHELLACVSPHAGYIYSGGVAGQLFGQLRVPRRVLVMGPNHGGIGAPGCDVNIALNLAIPTTSVSGLCQLPAIIPTNKSLLGRTLYTQFLLADPGANAAGLTSTNGMATYIGGQK